MRRTLFMGVVAAVAINLLLGSLHLTMAQETFQLRLSSFVPPKHFMNAGILQPWVDKIEKRSGGKLKIRIYSGSALGKPQDQYDIVLRGAADIAWGVAAYNPGRFPLTTVMELPFMYLNAEIGCRIIQRLYDRGYLKPEYKEVKLLALGMPPGLDVHSNKKLIKTIDDLTGMKVRVNSAMMGNLVKRWGKTPVAMPATEIYLSLDRGVIDVIFLDSLTLFGMRLNEVTKFHTVLGMSNTNFWFAMNKRTWERLPGDLKEIINELSGEYFSADIHGKAADKVLKGALAKLEKAGHTVYRLTPEELESWKKASVPAYDAWLKDMAAKGLPGGKVLEAAKRLRAELTK
ncbi:MAG: TRAP transporter substrate-binding protein [Deltaproteobacteria bacterium]|nr:TRAP transporter substrate-binding protein [Deltaproteobacteria bacterium]